MLVESLDLDLENHLMVIDALTEDKPELMEVPERTTAIPSCFADEVRTRLSAKIPLKIRRGQPYTTSPLHDFPVTRKAAYQALPQDDVSIWRRLANTANRKNRTAFPAPHTIHLPPKSPHTHAPSSSTSNLSPLKYIANYDTASVSK